MQMGRRGGDAQTQTVIQAIIVWTCGARVAYGAPCISLCAQPLYALHSGWCTSVCSCMQVVRIQDATYAPASR